MTELPMILIARLDGTAGDSITVWSEGDGYYRVESVSGGRAMIVKWRADAFEVFAKKLGQSFGMTDPFVRTPEAK